MRLHRRLIRCLQAYHRTQAQWEGVVTKALHLEDEIANLDNSQREFVRSNRELKLYLFVSHKKLVYKNIKASKCPKIKNVVVILLVAISISFEGFE